MQGSGRIVRVDHKWPGPVEIRLRPKVHRSDVVLCRDVVVVRELLAKNSIIGRPTFPLFFNGGPPGARAPPLPRTSLLVFGLASFFLNFFGESEHV